MKHCDSVRQIIVHIISVIRGAHIKKCSSQQYKSKDEVQSGYIIHLSRGGGHIVCCPTGYYLSLSMSLLVEGEAGFRCLLVGSREVYLERKRIVLLLRPRSSATLNLSLRVL
jgi:hypothetical protein